MTVLGQSDQTNVSNHKCSTTHSHMLEIDFSNGGGSRVVPGLLRALLVTSDRRVSQCNTASRKAGKGIGSGADKITASPHCGKIEHISAHTVYKMFSSPFCFFYPYTLPYLEVASTGGNYLIDSSD